MDAVEEIKKRLSIEDVIGEYVELKRAGRSYKGLSPFTSERTPSFMVSPDKQIWHDFSSNKGGDMFSFVMELEGLDFKGALEMLARKAGVDLSQYQRGDGTTGKRKERLFELMIHAAQYYQHVLLKSDQALKYLRQKRGYTKQTITDFQFGYAPESGDALYRYLRGRKFTDDEMRDAGVIVRRTGQPLDMFRGRITLPLSDGQGRIVGFTARILRDEPGAPKYINTPSTLIYDKGRQLFGLDKAKQGIRSREFVVVVEGNLDVVASHQAGVTNVVAVAGTALTMDHLKSLSRLTSDVRFAFDQDAAGVAATERAIPMAQGLGLSLSIIDIPSGKDPDELIHEDPKKWQEICEASTYVMDWLIAYYQNQHDLGSAQGKGAFSDQIIAAVRRLQDPIEQEHYLQQLAKLLATSFDSVQRKFASAGSEQKQPLKKRRTTEPLETSEDHKSIIHQDQLLALCLNTPVVRTIIKDAPKDLFSGEQRQKLLVLLQSHAGKKETLTREDLKDIEEYAKIMAFKGEELYRDYTGEQKHDEAAALINRLIIEAKTRKQENLTREIKAAELAGDAKQLHQLLETYNNLLKRKDAS